MMDFFSEMMDWLNKARGRFINMASSNNAGSVGGNEGTAANTSNNTSAATTPGASGVNNHSLCGGGTTNSDSAGASPTSERPFIHQRYIRQVLPVAHELEALVRLPSPLVDADEWLASHIIGLFENVSLLYDSIYESCSCSSMTGPGGWVCTAAGNSNGSTTARQYIDWVLSQAHELISVFPTRYHVAFASDFRVHVVTITRHLIHILVHLYGHHFNELLKLDLVSHTNTLAKHLFLFNLRFGLVDQRELEVIADLQSLLLLPSSPGASQPVTPASVSGDEVDPLVPTAIPRA